MIAASLPFPTCFKPEEVRLLYIPEIQWLSLGSVLLTPDNPLALASKWLFRVGLVIGCALKLLDSGVQRRSSPLSAS